MFCRYCENWRKGKRTQEGRECLFTEKIAEKSQEIPTNRKGEPCKGFTFSGFFWCDEFHHFKHFDVCKYGLKHYDDCMGCLQFEEVDLAMKIHELNHKDEFKRRSVKFAFLRRRSKYIPFKRRGTRNEKG